MTGEEITKLAFGDFENYCEARHPDRDDFAALTEEYAMDCQNGSWPPEGVMSRHQNRSK